MKSRLKVLEYNKANTAGFIAKNGIASLLELLGENVERPGLENTPEKFITGMQEILWGYDEDPNSIIKSAEKFKGESLIVLRDIELKSICEHHLLPFTGKIDIGYLPQGSIAGIGSIIKIANILAARLQTQERLADEIINVLNESILAPKGIIVRIEAEHMCVKMRGIDVNAEFVALSYLGAFRDDAALRGEFLNLVNS